MIRDSFFIVLLVSLSGVTGLAQAGTDASTEDAETSRVSISCKKVSGSVDDFGARHPAKYRACEPVPMLQWWVAPNHEPDEGGVAYVGYSATGLCFYVWLEDTSIYTEAREDEEKMWTLGDTVEFFIKQGEERLDYWEVHVTPNDLIMDIHIPSREKLSNDIWEEVLAPDSGSAKRVQVMKAENAWAVELCVPWTAFGIETAPAPGTAWQFNVGRYNYPGRLKDEENSSTAHLTAGRFHRYEEFTDLVFESSPTPDPKSKENPPAPH